MWLFRRSPCRPQTEVYAGCPVQGTGAQVKRDPAPLREAARALLELGNRRFSSAAMTPAARPAGRWPACSWNGSTVKTSPIVISPASMEARRPPTVGDGDLDALIGHAVEPSRRPTRLPIEHSMARQTDRSPSMNSVASPTTSAMASSIGPPSSATRAGDALVRGDGGVEQHRVAVGIDHFARVVEGHREMADVLAVRNRRARWAPSRRRDC